MFVYIETICNFEMLYRATLNFVLSLLTINLSSNLPAALYSRAFFLCPYINGCMWLNHQKNNRYNRTVYRKISLWVANQRVPKTEMFKSKLNQKAKIEVFLTLIELIRIGWVGKCLLRAYTSIREVLKMWKYLTGVVGYNSTAIQSKQIIE